MTLGVTGLERLPSRGMESRDAWRFVGLEHGLEHAPEQVCREIQSWTGFAVAKPSPSLGDGQVGGGPYGRGLGLLGELGKPL